MPYALPAHSPFLHLDWPYSQTAVESHDAERRDDAVYQIATQRDDQKGGSSSPATDVEFSDRATAIAEWMSRPAKRNSNIFQVARRVPTAHDHRFFEQMKRQLEADLQFNSSTTAMFQHPAYRQIVRMGYVAVPLLLRELKREPNQWFRALRDITGADPVPIAHRGRLQEMSEDWLRWGRVNGFQW